MLKKKINFFSFPVIRKFSIVLLSVQLLFTLLFLFFVLQLYVISGGRGHSPFMTEAASGVKRRTARRPPAVDGSEPYRPSHKPQQLKRSPYPRRTAEDQQAEKEVFVFEGEEEVDVEADYFGKSESNVTVVDCEGRGSSESGSGSEEEEEMASKRAEEGEMSKLLRYMVERDADARKAEAKEKKEREKREVELRKEAEDSRRADLMEMFRPLKGDEAERRRIEGETRARERAEEYERQREGDAERRREEDENRRKRKKEEDEQRERRDLQQEKLKVLVVYKESAELLGYLEKFERILRECKIDKSEWAERLFPRLPERLCSRIAGVRDEGGDYEAIKVVLLKAVGETSLTYGHQLFELSGEYLKSKTSGEVVELIERVCRGVLQECQTLEEAVVALATALTRRVIPPGGKTYLEGKKFTSMEGLRDAWETWMSGRQKGNFYKPLISSGMGGVSRTFGGGVSSNGGSERQYQGGVVICFSCGEKGHRAVDCRKNGARTTGSGPGVRTITCFACGKPGHRSVDCTAKKVGAPIKKETPVGRVLKIVVGGRKDNVAWGTVNGVECRILIDSGAEVGVVPRALVKNASNACGRVHISNVHGTTEVHESTIVTYVLGGLRTTRLAVIDEREGDDVICIIPFDVTNEEHTRVR